MQCVRHEDPVSPEAPPGLTWLVYRQEPVVANLAERRIGVWSLADPLPVNATTEEAR